MSLDIAKFSDSKKQQFQGSMSIEWFSEFTDKEWFTNFSKENGLATFKTSFVLEIDYENLSGISNPKLTKAKDALTLMESVVNIFKSEKYDYFKTYIKESDQPLQDNRVYINGVYVFFLKEFWWMTLKEFYEMKGIKADLDRIMVNVVVDDWSGEKHKITPGAEIELILKPKNFYTDNKDKIDASLKFLTEAASGNSYVQLMTT